MAKKHNLKWFETSAKSGQNVEQAFDYLAQQIKNKFEFEIESLRQIALEKGGLSSTKKKKCC